MAKSTTPKVAAPKVAKPKAPKKKSEKLPLPKDYIPALNIKIENEELKLPHVFDTGDIWFPALPDQHKKVDISAEENAKATVPPHVAAIRAIEAHMAADKDFAEAVRHNLDVMLFTAAKSRTVRRNKANISFIDLEAIVKEIAPNIIRIFENY